MAKKKRKGNDSQTKRNSLKRKHKQEGKQRGRQREANRRRTAEHKRIIEEREALRVAGMGGGVGLGSFMSGTLPPEEVLKAANEALKKK